MGTRCVVYHNEACPPITTNKFVVLKELERTGQKSNHEKKNRKRQAAKEAAEEQEAAMAKAVKPTENNNVESSHTPVVGRSTFF